MLRTVTATRYVVPLREGGSLPAIVEADDLGLYVLKFRGAGQGPRALVAELVAGEFGRALGLRVPELVLCEVDEVLGRNEPDVEIRHLLKASQGLNLALDYLPGATMFDPAARDRATAEEASLAVWFDSFVMNVDRTARNANLLVWHRELWWIDHGAAIFPHHDWSTMRSRAESRFPQSAQHVLLPWATQISAAGVKARAVLTTEVLQRVLAEVPDEWLTEPDWSPDAQRAAYLEFFERRLATTDYDKEAADAFARLI